MANNLSDFYSSNNQVTKFYLIIDRLNLPSYATNWQRIFIIDEAHRGYKTEGSFLTNLFDTDVNAVKIALTGTPLIKRRTCFTGTTSTHITMCVQELLDAMLLAELDKQEYHFPKQVEDISLRYAVIPMLGWDSISSNLPISMTVERVLSLILGHIYTPLPERCNGFRATVAHVTVRKEGMERNPWYPGKPGLSSMAHEATFAKVLLLTPNAIMMEHSGFGDKVYRVVEILEDEVRIRGYGKDIIRCAMQRKISVAYGKIIEIRRIR